MADHSMNCITVYRTRQEKTDFRDRSLNIARGATQCMGVGGGGGEGHKRFRDTVKPIYFEAHLIRIPVYFEFIA